MCEGRAMQDEYRGISRALQILTALNRTNGSTITELSRTTGISRPAVHRILTVLAEAGYVRRRDQDRAFFLTSKVKMLSDGFRDESWISEVAAPILDRLQQEVVWPTDLATFRGDRLQLVETTRRRSPLVIDRGLAGGQLSSIFRTALGLAYIAYARSAERDAIFDSYASKPDSPDAELARDPAAVGVLLAQVRKQGYASRFRGSVPETGTIAAPVLHRGHAVASIGVTFIASVLTVAEAATRHLAALTRAAKDIEAQLDGTTTNFRSAAAHPKPQPEPMRSSASARGARPARSKGRRNRP